MSLDTPYSRKEEQLNVISHALGIFFAVFVMWDWAVYLVPQRHSFSSSPSLCPMDKKNVIPPHFGLPTR